MRQERKYKYSYYYWWWKCETSYTQYDFLTTRQPIAEPVLGSSSRTRGFPGAHETHGFHQTCKFCRTFQTHRKRLNSQKRSNSQKKDSWTHRKEVPAPQPTPIHKMSMMPMVWNISIAQLGLTAWLWSLPALARLLISWIWETGTSPWFLSNSWKLQCCQHSSHAKCNTEQLLGRKLILAQLKSGQYCIFGTCCCLQSPQIIGWLFLEFL